MSAALFTAGLGDVIRSCYLNAGYRMLGMAARPMPVVVASHNPFAIEIFRHHRNSRNFILYDLGHKYQEFLAAGMAAPELNRSLCEFAGIDYAMLIREKAAGPPPVFDAPDDMDSTGHIVFQPFAGEASSRSLPQDLTARIVAVLRALPWPTYILTRSYPRQDSSGKSIHAVENARGFAGGSVTVLDQLTVPATLNLIKSCRAYVGSWSSLQQAAWLEDKPVAVFYPPGHADVETRTVYAFGLDRRNTLARPFPQADMAALQAFLRCW